MTSSEIRERFLKYFEERGHRVVPGAPLVPKLDPTLLFTTAGMNQFKAVFTGREKRDYVRAASSQKCVRAGGKHNDLENVGRTARHHTFFEMLGNFSFGDYFKKEAIEYAWEFVTKELNLPKEKLYVSVYRDDDEAFRIWNQSVGIDTKRIYRFGEKENFWSMGETGPCGPCSEIFFDQGKEAGCGKPDCDVGCDCDRYLEFWNLVFMEFDQLADGTRAKLPRPSIDTGMGLERVTAVANGLTSNYETDLFVPLLEKTGSLAGTPYAKASEEKKVSMRVIADHLRAATFLISEGVLPSNEGRGYVLRRIMRRAMRHGRKLGLTQPFLGDVAAVLPDLMGDTYPELRKAAKGTRSVIEEEEKRFSQTIDRGLALLETEIAKLETRKGSELSGEITFRLYDTYGFPPDLTADVLREHGLMYDRAGFDLAFAAHREKARGSWKGTGRKMIDSLVRKWVDGGLRTEFLGYDRLCAEGTIRALVRDGKEVGKADAGEEMELLADRTPFYGASGGQAGDIGVIEGEGFTLEVVDSEKPSPDIVLHRCKVGVGTVRPGDKGVFQVDTEARAATAKNHTATHVLHATLKEILGSHVKQSGSLVSPERLRFDFTHPRALTQEEIGKIEQIMNERIWADTRVEKKEMPLNLALKSGAVALFDEKYGEQVRVISIADYSRELCGGTHLDRTGEIGLFKVTKESSVAAGVRRLEAFTGRRALSYVQEVDRKLKEITGALGSTQEGVLDRVDSLLGKQKDLEKELRKARSSGAASSEGSQVRVSDVNGVKLVRAVVDEADAKTLREAADRHLEGIKSGVVAVGCRNAGKASVVVKVSKDLAGRVNAGKLVQAAAQILGGSGGGRAEMAQAGGPNVDALEAALNSLEKAI
ncbi:MAG: alanine--tRNA ligase [Pseudomonadota bacterium]